MSTEMNHLGVPAEDSGRSTAPVGETPNVRLRPDAPAHEADMLRRLEVALSICTGSDPHREWMNDRFSIGDLNCATEGHIIAAFRGAPLYGPCGAKADTAKQIAEWHDGASKGLVPFSGKLLAKDILEADANWPLTDECEECNGSGEVDCECECGDEHQRKCDDCNGDGVTPNGKMNRDIAGSVHLEGLAHFKAVTWGRLAEIVKTTGIEEFTITHGAPFKAMRLVTKDSPLVLCIMPALHDTGDIVFRAINVLNVDGAADAPKTELP